MNAWTAHGASGRPPNIDIERTQRPLDREDQTAIELGFPPPGGLTWRRRRVHQLRERIESGAYEVDPGRVAEAMLARLREAS
jgi:anti-sigma28 factor (negative regulator of flagellin synthesis)